MLQNSTHQPPQSQPQSFQFMRKVCQQIQQQVHLLLTNHSIQDASHLNPKTLQKCITSTKNSILKSITSHLPQIIAIQDKFKTLILQINQDLQTQIQKNKQLFLKYQDLILQSDRYKMETVHLGQLYDQLYQQNNTLKNQLNLSSSQQLPQHHHQPLQLFTQHTQTNDSQYKIISLLDFIKLQQRLIQHKQQRQLFKQQLTSNNQIIQQLNKNLQNYKSKIQQLLQEIKHYHHLIQIQQQNQSNLKKQITKLQSNLQQSHLIHSNQLQTLRQQHKNQLTQHLTQSQQKHLTLTTHLQQQKHTYQQSLKKIQQQTLHIKQLTNKIKQIDQNLSQKSIYLDQIKQIIDSKNMQLIHTKSQLNHSLQNNKQLLRKINKINQLIKTQSILQNKYNKKLNLLTKQKKQLQSKSQFYQSQNQRLYQAMNQFASKQLKITNKLTNTQNKLSIQQLNLDKYYKVRQKLYSTLFLIIKQLNSIKKLLYGQFQISIIKIFKQFTQHFLYQKNTFLQKFQHKLSNFSQQQSLTNEKLHSHSNKLQKQYKILQQKYQILQQNSSQITKNILLSKNYITTQIQQKQQIIKYLQQQLIKQKQFNQCTTNKLSNVILKYQNIYLNNNTNNNTIKNNHINNYHINNNHANHINNNNNQNQNNQFLSTKTLENQQDQLLLQKQIIQQKNRFTHLQCQYQTLIRH